ncbi:MAG: ammonium transporter [bacterium]|nr:ammonium transporter [bacterium]MDE0239512.1 ammonium transporter [bacterium]MDE0417281.1 ammonium transporter [bacterium]
MTPEELQAAVEWSTKISAEGYYWWSIGLMVAIHAGFLMYEMGASRVKNTLASGCKNILAFAFIIPTMFMFGWWVYLAFPHGIVPNMEYGLFGEPWNEFMGPNLSDNITGVIWGAFVLFSATTASIMSGSVIERIRMGSFIILAVALGSFAWLIGASWGWHPEGWLVTEFGYHDVGASGVVHIISGFFALGVLINLGPRIGKFGPNGEINNLQGHSVPMTIAGLMIIIIGFVGFMGACLLYNGTGQWGNIYGGPTTLSAWSFNLLMSFGGGIIGAYAVTRDPFWMMSGALGGIFAAAAGLDLYYPPLAFALGFAGGVLIPYGQRFLEKLRIDDAVGAVSVHGFCGILGVLACGIFLDGYPAVSESIPGITFWGQLVGCVVMVLIGFVPGYVLSLILKMLGILRASDEIQQVGMDLEIPSPAYPEQITSHLHWRG